MRYCVRCVMPDTRPGLTIDSDGVCSACRHTEYKKTINWGNRQKSFAKLCDTYRSYSDQNDCIVAVSSGKDSFWQVHQLVDKYHMNPLLVSVWNGDWTQTGLENFQLMQDKFGVEAICLHSNNEVNRKLSRTIFEHAGYTAYLFDRYIYTYPIWMSIRLNIPLVFYGENSSLEYGGPLKEDTPYAYQQINNDAVKTFDASIWAKANVSMKDVPYAEYPDARLMSEADISPRFMSYYFNWSGYEHMLVAKQLGWKSLNDTGEWNRIGWIDDYNQIDDFAYLVDPWLKYPKLGHRQVTDMCSRLIRDNQMTREEAIPLVREKDAQLDPTSLEHYLKFSHYTERQFWDIVETHYNKNLFEKKGGKWKLLNSI